MLLFVSCAYASLVCRATFVFLETNTQNGSMYKHARCYKWRHAALRDRFLCPLKVVIFVENLILQYFICLL